MVGVYQNTVVNVQTENRFGCLLFGSSTIKIFPPDIEVKLKETKCFTNDTALVTFTICMNNGYDSVWRNIPVSFYDGDPAGSTARLLQPAFRTAVTVPDTCATYTVKVKAPLTNTLVAVVNDKGDNRAVVPSQAFPETDSRNNSDRAAYTPFTVSIVPSDTAIDRLTGVRLSPGVQGGTATSFAWQPDRSLSCSDCPAPVATPPHTSAFFLTAQNEAFCTDTAYAIVRTHSQSGIYLPSAFTPNADGRNDVFYVIAGKEVSRIKSFSVYNRWGQVVHAVRNVPANTPLHGWRGKLGSEEAPPEVYVYYVVVLLQDGKEKSARGTVTLIR
jgi:gliding motility-associated-like protein